MIGISQDLVRTATSGSPNSTELTFLQGYWALEDLLLAILPVTFLYNLKMSVQKKMALCVLLGLGVLWVKLISCPHSLLTGVIISAAICAAIKASYLPTLTTKSDFTCKLQLYYQPRTSN